MGEERKRQEESKAISETWSWYKIVSIDPDFNMPEKKIYVGTDAAQHMLDALQADAENIFADYIEKPKELNMSPEEEDQFNSATECHICGGKLKSGEIKVNASFIYRIWLIYLIT